MAGCFTLIVLLLFVLLFVICVFLVVPCAGLRSVNVS